MFKQLTFADQWIGYDDAETVALKKGWGNDFCFGGTMQVSYIQNPIIPRICRLRVMHTINLLLWSMSQPLLIGY